MSRGLTQRLLGSHTYSVRAFCFGRSICRLSVCLSRVRSCKLSEIGAKFYQLYRKSGSASKNMTLDFAPDVAKYSVPTFCEFDSTSASYCMGRLCRHSVFSMIFILLVVSVSDDVTACSAPQCVKFCCDVVLAVQVHYYKKRQWCITYSAPGTPTICLDLVPCVLAVWCNCHKRSWLDKSYLPQTNLCDALLIMPGLMPIMPYTKVNVWCDILATIDSNLLTTLSTTGDLFTVQILGKVSEKSAVIF